MEALVSQFVAYFGWNGTVDSGNVTRFLAAMQMDQSLVHQLQTHGECPGHNFSSQHWYQTGAPVNDLILAVWQTAQTPACYAVRNDTDIEIEEAGAAQATNSPLQVWGYGILCVTVINLCALLGALFVPLIGHRLYRLIMIFMTSLAVGSLLATALLILLPDSMQLAFIHEELTREQSVAPPSSFPSGRGSRQAQEPVSTGWEQFLSKHPWYIWRCCGVFGGVYLFFALERLLKELLGWKGRGNGAGGSHGGHSHSAGAAAAAASVELIDAEGAASCAATAAETKAAAAAAARRTSRSGRLAQVQPVAWMILLGDSLHNFIDGLSIGAGFGKSSLTGLSISLAVLCEELPHELGDFAVLLSAGMSVPMAIAGNLASACACYVGFALGVLLGDIAGVGVWIFAVGGGMFLYISLVDMMPEVNDAMDTEEARRLGKVKIFLLQNVGLLVGFGVILVIAIYGGDIKLG